MAREQLGVFLLSLRKKRLAFVSGLSSASSLLPSTVANVILCSRLATLSSMQERES